MGGAIAEATLRVVNYALLLTSCLATLRAEEARKSDDCQAICRTDGDERVAPAK